MTAPDLERQDWPVLTGTAYNAAVRKLVALPHTSILHELTDREERFTLTELVDLICKYVPQNSVGAPPEVS